MAEIWGAVIVGGAALAGSAYSANRAGAAADAQGRAGDAAINEQGRQFDTLLSLNSNQRAIGNQALNALASSYGYNPAMGYGGTYTDAGVTGKFDPQAYLAENPDVAANPFFRQYPEEHYARHGQYEGRNRPIVGGTASTRGGQQQGNALGRADYSQFYNSPDYQHRLSEGLNAVQGSAAAQGGLYSGNALRGINDYAQNSAAGEYGNYFNRQLALAGMGQAATTQSGNAALATGANIGNLLMQQGNARASGIIGQGNAVAGGINDLASVYGLYQGGYFNRGGG